ncbi:Actin-related protein [Cynara cardunculus var. scolymus]|uniref:Actin-related protein n=1 Tax=Cynara cardunculus var. scolymus TaxID=59895 RepID=A0A103XK29_CYNCS|nr:Actin-related protein [Cynara cardunculus var. scolymus]
MNLLGKQAHELTMAHRRKDVNTSKERHFAEESKIIQQQKYLVPNEVQVKLALENIALDFDIADAMLRNVVLGGGSTLFIGLAQRLTKEIRDMGSQRDREAEEDPLPFLRDREADREMLGPRGIREIESFSEMELQIES